MGDRSSSGDPHTFFSEFSSLVAKWTGSHWALLIAAGLVVVSLSLFGVEITNIGISVVTLLMVFVLQNTQNRDGHATQVKLDELIRSVDGAHNGLLDIEELSEAELLAFREKYAELAKAARDEIRRDVGETGSPTIEFPKTD